MRAAREFVAHPAQFRLFSGELKLMWKKMVRAFRARTSFTVR
jgi:hypothetical protein